jgi:hypothetical protein
METKTDGFQNVFQDQMDVIYVILRFTIWKLANLFYVKVKNVVQMEEAEIVVLVTKAKSVKMVYALVWMNVQLLKQIVMEISTLHANTKMEIPV